MSDPTGATLYYAETAPSESGLVMGLWFDENGNEKTAFETLFAASSGRRRAEKQLPAAYDARQDGLLTPVKLQVGNTCWAFASIACMEANAIKKGLSTADSIDLSEGHLVWHGRNAYVSGETDPRNDGLAADSAEQAVNAGGNASYVAQAVQNFMGPANECDYPVDMTSASTLAQSLKETMTFSDRFARAYDFTALHRIVADEMNIKKAVLTYGAAEQYFYTENQYYTNRVPATQADKAIPATYYYPNDVETAKINHAVVIVGWDDTFSKDNFTGLAKPESDGAWLCRNSWSTAFGNDGYFWMSYENHGCYGAVNAYEIEAKDETRTVQYYDGFGSHSTIDATAAGNIFVAQGDAYLRAVSFGAPLESYTFSVYTGLSATAVPDGGTCVYTQSGNAYGKSVIALEGKVPLSAGERYSVVFRELTSVPIEGFSEKSGNNNYQFTSAAGTSYYYNTRWLDGFETKRNNVCIRAFEKTQGAPFTVTFACPSGGFETAVTTTENTVALPVAPEGYTYVFTCNGAAFDGSGVTQDITVRTHCYPTAGKAAADDPCRVEYRCIYCGEEQQPSVQVHTMEAHTVSPCETSPGYTLHTCVHGDYGTLSDVTLLDGAIGGAAGETLAWQLFDGTLSIGGIGALPQYTASSPAPWHTAQAIVLTNRIVIGEGITALGAQAISDFAALKEISLPASLQNVSDTSFGCGSLTALRSVTVAAGNPTFKGENGVLLSADGSKLWLYPAAKEGAVVRVPETVTAFAAYSFSGNQQVQFLDLSVCGAAELPRYFCSGAAVLQHVNLPKTLTKMGLRAFYNPDGVLPNIFITQMVTMPAGDVFGNCPKIYVDKSSSSARNYAATYNNSNYYLLTGHAHAYTQETLTFAAACDVPAYEVKTCQCGNFSFTQTAAPGHNFGAWTSVSAQEHRRICANDAAHVETAAHSWNTGTVTVKPTCTQTGEKTFTCTVCGATKTEALDALEHHFGAWEPVDENEHRRVCANDAAHVETAAHSWNTGAVTVKPTCTAKGEKTFTCTVCGATKTEPLDALEHHFGAWVPFDENEHRRVCTNDAAHVETAAHSWNAGTVTVKPTCTETGEKTFTCTVCGATKTEPVDALEHHFGAWEPFDENEHRRVCANDAAHVETAAHTWNAGTVTVKPTCTARGEKTFSCTVCGATKTEAVAALGHTSPDGGGNCTRCGAHLKDVTDPNACAYCGEVHSGLFGWLVGLIHSLLFRLFGSK